MPLSQLLVDEYRDSDHEVLTLEQYFERCKDDPMAYAKPAERMISAIGEPTLVDTSKDPRLARIFQNRTIRTYDKFADFYGLENTIDEIVGFFRHAAQGLEERKQILYLLGPVGGGKSSLAERLKELMEIHPIYVLAYCPSGSDFELSPIFETPLGMFQSKDKRKTISEEYNIPIRYFNTIPSPWFLKRWKQAGENPSKFRVIRMKPSKLDQIGISKTEPGDENNQDISSLVGKTDIRKLERYSQNDVDSYSFSGGLCRANQGMLEFVEMFKAPIKVLHPLLTATQEGNYVGTEAIGAIPFGGIVLAHSNESEWQSFRSNKNNEAFLDRICVIKIPYCLRLDEEQKIYSKIIEESSLTDAPCAPQTKEMLAKWAILSRLKEHENSTLQSKMRVYNGEDLKEKDPRAKSIQEYRDVAGINEGMHGMSTRFAYKVLSNTFNFTSDEIAADPVHLMVVLQEAIKKEDLPEEEEKKLLAFVKDELATEYAKFLGKEIQKAYLESYRDYGQNIFMRYLSYADAWVQDQDFKDADTGLLLDRNKLNEELEKIEKGAPVSNPKDFRHEIVGYALRHKAKTGVDLKWTDYAKIREVIEKRMFSKVEDLLPIISFEEKKDEETAKKHNEFVERMTERGYTPRQIRRLCEWWMRVHKSSS